MPLNYIHNFIYMAWYTVAYLCRRGLPPYHASKFYPNPYTTFGIILPTDTIDSSIGILTTPLWTYTTTTTTTTTAAAAAAANAAAITTSAIINTTFRIF